MRKNLFTALLSFIIIGLIPLTISASDISPLDDMFSGGPDSSYVVIRKTGTMFSVPTKSYAIKQAKKTDIYVKIGTLRKFYQKHNVEMDTSKYSGDFSTATAAATKASMETNLLYYNMIKDQSHSGTHKVAPKTKQPQTHEVKWLTFIKNLFS